MFKDGDRRVPVGASTAERSNSGPIVHRLKAVVSTGLCCFFLVSCAAGLQSADFGTDTTIITSSVSSQSNSSDRQAASDVTTIRNAVSSANLEELGDQPLSWANQDTGSRGAVTKITEYRDTELVCRRFTVSRESFEGITLYRGDACLLGDGIWTMREFLPV